MIELYVIHCFSGGQLLQFLHQPDLDVTSCFLPCVLTKCSWEGKWISPGLKSSDNTCERLKPKLFDVNYLLYIAWDFCCADVGAAMWLPHYLHSEKYQTHNSQIRVPLAAPQ